MWSDFKISPILYRKPVFKVEGSPHLSLQPFTFTTSALKYGRDSKFSTPRQAATQILQKSPLRGPQKDQSFLNFLKPRMHLGLTTRIRSLNIHYVGKTRTGIINGLYKAHNQDDFLFEPKLNGHKDVHLLGVIDGHGPEGHFVTQFVKEAVPREVSLMLSGFDFIDMSPSEIEQVKLAWKRAFHRIHTDLIGMINCEISGCVCNFVLFIGTHCFCANLGDSRAIIGAEASMGWEVKILSMPHKPENSGERKRIEAFGGRVAPSVNLEGHSLGPLRVWNGNKAGLAVSRALGDTAVATVGVIQEADVIHQELKLGDRFVVLGTDGLWDQLQDIDVLSIVRTYWKNRDIEGACNKLVEVAASKYSRNHVDDITVIIAFL